MEIQAEGSGHRGVRPEFPSRNRRWLAYAEVIQETKAVAKIPWENAWKRRGPRAVPGEPNIQEKHSDKRGEKNQRSRRMERNETRFRRREQEGPSERMGAAGQHEAGGSPEPSSPGPAWAAVRPTD